MMVVVFWHIPVDTVLIGGLFSAFCAYLYLGMIHRFGEPAVRGFVAMEFPMLVLLVVSFGTFPSIPFLLDFGASRLLYIDLIHRFGEPAVRRFSEMRQPCGYLYHL